MTDARIRLVEPGKWKPSGVTDLEAAAWSALLESGSASVAAGPGSGKTEFLAQKAAYLLQTGGCPAPQRILAISFKRDAAKNLARRVEQRVPNHNGRFVSLTFDAFTKGLVDRFGASLPPPWTIAPGGYEIRFWNDREVGDVLAELQAAAQPERQSEFFGMQGGRFLKDQLGLWKIPLGDNTNAPAGQYPEWSWWSRFVSSPVNPELDFTMINRLAELLIRANPRLARALRATYPIVFIDEFQDTTGAQMDLLESLFAGQSTRLTAVGDRKQRIMRFAGAMEDAIAKFETVFSARHFDLIHNFRSSPPLVELQHRIASEIDPDIVAAISQAQSDTGISASLWTFNGEQDQAAQIANWIAGDMAASERTASDYALLAKQKIADLEAELATALSARGIELRNDDLKYGGIALQDLLKHEASTILLAILRLATEPAGNGDLWSETLRLIAPIIAPSEDEVAVRRAADQLGLITRDLGSWLASHAPRSVTGNAIVSMIVDLVGRRNFESYFAGQYFSESLSELTPGLAARIDSVRTDSAGWDQVLKRVTAADAVTLMTIHRSKGLEYHTVILIGLDEDQWWAYRYDTQEATSAFFVALSRAKQRLVITRATANVGRQNTGRFYEMLAEAGVSESRPSEVT